MADTVSVTQADAFAVLRGIVDHIEVGTITVDAMALKQLLAIEARHRLASTQPAPAFPREAELIEALRPFAEAAEDLEPDHHDTTSIWETPAAAGIDARHLRRAAFLLQDKQP